MYIHFVRFVLIVPERQSSFMSVLFEISLSSDRAFGWSSQSRSQTQLKRSATGKKKDKTENYWRFRFIILLENYRIDRWNTDHRFGFELEVF